MTKSRGIRPPRRAWTDDELRAVRARYPNERTEDIARSIGRPIEQVYRKAAALRLTKSPEYLASPASCRTNGRQGIGTRFEKGLVPWNKGMKGLQIDGCKATQFKPGTRPFNTLPIGSYKYDKDGVLLQKISNASGNNSKRWRAVHELVWIKEHGPLPPKHIVVFKPGMRTNVVEEITVDRVECISLAENMRRNTRHNLPKEINEIIQLRAVLTRHINKRSKHEQREEND